MLKALTILGALLASGTSEAATWYVATSGSDSSAGSSEAPFKTWQRAVDVASPGDIVEIGAGTYAISATRRDGVRIRRDGTSAAPIVLRGAAGERPVLDCSGLKYNSSVYCLILDGADWWRISNVDVTGAKPPSKSSFATGIAVYNGNNNVLDDVASYRNQGAGIRVQQNSANNLLSNCDSHHNYDPQTNGGNADGFHISYLTTSAVGNRVVGCRAWANSDDGFDLWSSNVPVTIEDSWSFDNGFIPDTKTTAGNGAGFKLGLNSVGPKHRITRNLAFENRRQGFYDNGAKGPQFIVNNTAYANGSYGFQFSQPYPYFLRNNVAVGTAMQLHGAVDDEFNSWNLGGAAAGDFVSVDDTGVDGPRQADGSLPELPFLHPSPVGNLIDKGVDVGMPMHGVAPDLGAYEDTGPPGCPV